MGMLLHEGRYQRKSCQSSWKRDILSMRVQVLFPLGTIEWKSRVHHRAFFFFFPLGIVRVKSIQVKCDSGNTMWHHKLKQMGLLLMWKIWQQQQQTKSAATSCGHITSRFLINEISHRFNNFLINMIVKIQHPPRKEAATNDYYWWICWSSSL